MSGRETHAEWHLVQSSLKGRLGNKTISADLYRHCQWDKDKICMLIWLGNHHVKEHKEKVRGLCGNKI